MFHSKSTKQLFLVLFTVTLLLSSIGKILSQKYLNEKENSSQINITLPSIKVYIESLCPDTLRFINYSFKNFYNLKNKYDLYSSLTFVPYGNAYESSSSKNGQREFSCQHGEKECHGNRILNCAIEYLTIDISEQFILCFAGNITKSGRMSADLNDLSSKCLKEIVNDDENTINKINDCASSSEGDELLHIAGEDTKSHSRIPYILVNNEHEDKNNAEFDLIGYMCKYNKLVGIIEGC